MSHLAKFYAKFPNGDTALDEDGLEMLAEYLDRWCHWPDRYLYLFSAPLHSCLFGHCGNLELLKNNAQALFGNISTSSTLGQMLSNLHAILLIELYLNLLNFL